jgi:hypothetical protein
MIDGSDLMSLMGVSFGVGQNKNRGGTSSRGEWPAVGAFYRDAREGERTIGSCWRVCNQVIGYKAGAGSASVLLHLSMGG